MKSIQSKKSRLTFLLLPFLVASAFRLNHPADAGQHQIFGNASPAISTFENTRSGEIPKEVARKFRRDAARLALRFAAGGEDFRYLGTAIPKENTDLIFNALGNIYLNEERGKSLEKCNIHTFPNPSIDHLVVIYNKNIAWARPLQNGITETDSKAINDLLDRHHLFIEKHVNWTDNQDAITIRAKDPINMAAIANEFEQIEGVVETDLGVPKALGNDIEVRRYSGGWEFDYILRFGSWATGKGKAHVWKYRVSDGGKIAFVSETGDAVPEWIKCQNGGPRMWAGI